MELLKERIRKEGKILPNNIVKIDGFLNHKVDTLLMKEIAKEFIKYLPMDGLTAVVTIEASGIPIATICALEYGVPMIFAKKAKSDNIEGGLFKSQIYSYTYKKEATLLLSKEWLNENDKVLIIDDFLAKGSAISGIIDIIEESKAEILGIGIAVEKGFQVGGKIVRDRGYPVHSLAIIEKADENGIVFR